MNSPATLNRRSSRWLVLAVLGIAVLVDVGVRVRLLDIPLERDEGEYAYVGQLMLEGIPPYQLACNMKMPGIYLAYAAIMAAFGQTPAGIHLGLLVVHLATLAVLFLIARSFFDVQGAVISTVAYALMTLSRAYLGLAAHATHFVMLPALLGLYLLLRMQKNGRLLECFASGCFFGVAFLMKQPGMFFGIFGGLYLFWVTIAVKTGWRQVPARLGLYSLGCLLPFLTICLWLKYAGVFPQFWFWTFTYAHEYATAVSLTNGIYNARHGFAMVFKAAPLLWIIASWGLGLVCYTRMVSDKRVFLGGFLLFSLLAVCPGLYFREHYFIVLAPAIALMTGLAVSSNCQRLAIKSSTLWLCDLPFLLAMFAFVQSLCADRAILFSLSPRQACRAIYHLNPFTESLDIARYIEKNTGKDQRIVVMGDEPQIYFYAHRHSSTSQIYPSQLMDPRPYALVMQKRMIREIEQNPPAYLVMVRVPTSWVVQPHSISLLFDWANGYIKQNMKTVGFVQLGNLRTTEIWGPDAATVPFPSDFYVAVYKRAPSPPDQDKE